MYVNRSDVYLNTTSKFVSCITDVQSCHPGDDHVLLTLTLSAGVYFLATRVITTAVQTRCQHRQRQSIPILGIYLNATEQSR